MYTAGQIANILESDVSYLKDQNGVVSYITMDTRKVEIPSETIFFALSGSMHDGHDFLYEAVNKGIRHLVVEKLPEFEHNNTNIYLVENSLKAMQTLAAWHRSNHKDLTTIAITGSNGKTTIKEWLYQMITDRKVVKSPKSYNSQTGVALSVWQIKDGDELGIFEAGISQPGEMTSLEKMIQPQIGLLTVLGDAHAEGFKNLAEKLEEKLILFKNTELIIFEEDDLIVSTAIREKYSHKQLISWGRHHNASLFTIKEMTTTNYQTKVEIMIGEELKTFTIPFSDTASIKNVLHCIATMLILQIDIDDIKESIHKLHNIPMRLEMKNGIQNSILINDTYNADLQSFKIALEFLSQQAGSKEKVVILSDFMQTGLDPQSLNHQLAGLIHNHNITHIIAVGEMVRHLEKHLDPFILFSSVNTTDRLLETISDYNFNQKAVLVKGARAFQLEKVIHALSDKAHTATLETDLQAIEHNLKIFSQDLSSGTQIIAVIKASAYGSGSEELARYLEFKKVSYLAVAFIDEGVQLRKSGVLLPIMILNPDRKGVLDMVKYNLEPEVYSLQQLDEIVSIIVARQDRKFNIHLKIDTGMHRLGFMSYDMNELCQILNMNHQLITVKSIFSHLSSSEDSGDDVYTHLQVQKLNEAYSFIIENIGYSPLKHILNSSGIIRFPQYHFDMVRLGLGLYGIDSTNHYATKLQKVHSLKATVVQIKNVDKSATVGYNRKGKLRGDGKIAIINIGYADGLMRLAGNRKYDVRIHNIDYPIIGNICMDLTIIDISDATNVKVGDEAIIFNADKPVEKLAEVCQTIPYEILSRISARVRRVYIQG